MGDVIRLIERSSIPCDTDDLNDWLRDWANHIADGKQGDILSVVMFVERKDGTMFKVSQSRTFMDAKTVVGLAHMGILAMLDGRAKPYETPEENS